VAGSGQSGEGEVVDLALFRRQSEERKLRELFAPDAAREPGAGTDEPEPSGGLVVEVGRDVWPGTSPLDSLTAKVADRDHGLLAECRAALAEAPDPAHPDDVADAVAVLRAFLTRLGDGGLPLAGDRGIAESSIALALLNGDSLDLWKGEGLAAASPRHPARRVRSVATALGLVRAHGPALVVTRRGATLRDSPAALWDHVVRSLPLERTPGGRDAGLLVLLLTAAGRAAPDRSFERTVNSIGERLRLNSPTPDFSPRDTLGDAARTVDVLSWAGHGRIRRLGLDHPRFPRWAGLHWDPACRLARAAVLHLS
jgi:hypothetical protein